MSKNLSTASESNPEVMSEGDKVRAYLTLYKHTNGTLVATVLQRSLQVTEFQLSLVVAAKDADVETV